MERSLAKLDKRQKILHATKQLLATDGFHGFSMKSLAKKAGVAVGTVYLYFSDKNDLIQQLHRNILEDVAEVVLRNYDSSTPLFIQYETFWRNMWQFCLENPELVLSKGQFDHLPKDIHQQDLNFAKDLFMPFTTLFERGRKSGLIKNMPDDVLGTLSIETCTELARKQLLGLIQVSDKLLSQVISASWDAITEPESSHQ